MQRGCFLFFAAAFVLLLPLLPPSPSGDDFPVTRRGGAISTQQAVKRTGNETEKCLQIQIAHSQILGFSKSFSDILVISPP